MSCVADFANYGLRSIGIGERLLPRSDISGCEQIALVAGGLFWNLYFAVIAVAVGFFLAFGSALLRYYGSPLVARLARAYVTFFRGTPLFIQFFFGYALFEQIPKLELMLGAGNFGLTLSTAYLTKAWCGAVLILCLNTSAYGGEILYGAMRAVPKADIEAARAYGLREQHIFRFVLMPTTLRLAWPAYTNEAIFLFHATALVFFSAFPVWRQKGDALYYASYLAETTFNPFVAYPLAAAYFMTITGALILSFSLLSKRLNRHLPANLGQPNKGLFSMLLR